MIEKFLEYLEQEVANHSIYVWGGQGQMLKNISDYDIRRMETTDSNASRAIRKKQLTIAQGYGDVARIFDCSGLIVYWLMQNGLISYDTTAQGLRSLSTSIKKDALTPGSLVFRVSNSNAYHVGVFVGNGYVIEAKGRDDGVVKQKSLGSGYWTHYGDLKLFAGDKPVDPPKPKPPAKDKYVLDRVLRLKTPYMRGDDVQQAQAFLLGAKVPLGSTGADGVFGGATDYAVRLYQQEKRLEVDGQIGQKTWESFGGTWNG